MKGGALNENRGKDDESVTRLVKDPDFEPAIQMFWDIATKWENVHKVAREVNLSPYTKKRVQEVYRMCTG